jgi:hypothetical protein
MQMANFRYVPGKGKWNASESTLTVTNGDEVEVVLWGGGPDGKPLVLCVDNGNLISAVSEKAGPGAAERTFKFKARGPGTVTLFARVGGPRGSDYVQPLKLIILPKKASSIGPEHVVLFAGKESDEEYIARESYQKAVAAGGTAYRIKSIHDFINLLTRYRDEGRKIARMEINTHGAPGKWSFGNGTGITKASLSLFRGQGFHAVFSAGARIFFHGCNIADGDEGEEFLKEFGMIFLVGGGGSVAASTSLGFGTGMLGGSKTYHLWGDVVRVYISNDGRVEKVERK